MQVLLVTIHIMPEHKEEFMEAMLDDARGSIENEPGCFRFDVIQDETDPNRIYLYEVYCDEAAFQAHTQQPHFLRWQEKVKDWYAQPTVVLRGHHIFPSDDSPLWRKP